MYHFIRMSQKYMNYSIFLTIEEVTLSRSISPNWKTRKVILKLCEARQSSSISSNMTTLYVRTNLK